jgi:hypothetical protein
VTETPTVFIRTYPADAAVPPRIVTAADIRRDTEHARCGAHDDDFRLWHAAPDGGLREVTVTQTRWTDYDEDDYAHADYEIHDLVSGQVVETFTARIDGRT